MAGLGGDSPGSIPSAGLGGDEVGAQLSWGGRNRGLLFTPPHLSNLKAMHRGGNGCWGCGGLGGGTA